MHLSYDFALNFISPWIDFCPFRSFANCRIVGIMSTLLGRDQLRDVAHDLVPDLFELFTMLLSVTFCFKGTERLADVELDPGAASTLETGENIIEPDQAHG